MDLMKTVLAHFDEIEALVIRATGLITISIFCLIYIRRHIREFNRGESKAKRRNRGKRGVVSEQHTED
jgi:hypothetical protein